MDAYDAMQARHRLWREGKTELTYFRSNSGVYGGDELGPGSDSPEDVWIALIDYERFANREAARDEMLRESEREEESNRELWRAYAAKRARDKAARAARRREQRVRLAEAPAPAVAEQGGNGHARVQAREAPVIERPESYQQEASRSDSHERVKAAVERVGDAIRVKLLPMKLVSAPMQVAEFYAWLERKERQERHG
jgi:hypothetical protein